MKLIQDVLCSRGIMFNFGIGGVPGERLFINDGNNLFPQRHGDIRKGLKKFCLQDFII